MHAAFIKVIKDFAVVVFDDGERHYGSTYEKADKELTERGYKHEHTVRVSQNRAVHFYVKHDV